MQRSERRWLRFPKPKVGGSSPPGTASFKGHFWLSSQLLLQRDWVRGKHWGNRTLFCVPAICYFCAYGWGDLMRTLVLALLILAILPAAAQNSPPLSGHVSNTQEMSSLYYSCRPSGSGAIECEFVQTSVRQKAKPEDLPKKIAEARAEFRKTGLKGFPKEECDGYRKIVAMMRGNSANLTAEQRQWLLTMTPRKRQHLNDSFDAMMRVCDNPTEEAFIKLVELEHSKNMRTCRVSSNTYRQTLKRVSPDVYTANEGPSGDCGIINVSRLERATDSKLFFNYRAKKIITNPKATFFISMLCEQLDQAEYLYTWRTQEWTPTCDFLEFGQ